MASKKQESAADSLARRYLDSVSDAFKGEIPNRATRRKMGLKTPVDPKRVKQALRKEVRE